MTGRWSCWLAAEAALIALLLGGCAWGGDEAPARQPEPRPPVVVVVFDELPADGLLGPDGRIDAARFPNFARLARISTWFPNGHTVYDSTFKAVPSILDGRLPRPRTASDVRSHKPSVFHLVDRLDYEVFKVESASAVCPPGICAGARTRRPGVLRRLAGGGRPARWHRWLGSIRRRSRPGFWFHHALLPHEPWLYLPSGRQNRPAGNDPIEGINKPPGFDDPGLSEHNHLRHLLQVGYVDRQIGELLGRLERTRQLRDALVIVTADHGYSFRIGPEVASRRLLGPENVEEIAPVPFFVKAPGQLDGRVSRAPVRNLDIVATIADLLGTPVWWRQEGVSAFAHATRERTAIEVATRDFASVVRIDLAELEQRRSRWRRRWASQFGTGTESRLLYGDPWALAYRIGPHPELLDRRVARFEVRPRGAVDAVLANAGLYEHVSGDGAIYPTRITGALHGVAPGDHHELAVAVNGRIRAVGRSFDLWLERREFFSFVVPESALREGRNEVELFELLPGGALQRL